MSLNTVVRILSRVYNVSNLSTQEKMTLVLISSLSIPKNFFLIQANFKLRQFPNHLAKTMNFLFLSYLYMGELFSKSLSLNKLKSKKVLS